MSTILKSGAERHLNNRASFSQAVRNSLTMAYRGLLRIRRTPEQLFDVTFQPILFTLMFTYIFGGAIAGDVASYLPVIIPGILVQTVITTSIVTGVQLREDMEKGVFDRFKSLPIAKDRAAGRRTACRHHPLYHRNGADLRDGLPHGAAA